MGALSRRHIILAGLPGAGKSTVGRLAASLLDTQFVDFDRAIEQRAGKPVARIFAEDGESAFRALESEVGMELLRGEPAVLAPGGGYFTDDARRRAALAAGYAIYLETSPSVAARRLKGVEVRPLLAGFDPVLRLRQLLEQREAGYLEAPGRVTTDYLAPEQVAARVVELARSEAGW